MHAIFISDPLFHHKNTVQIQYMMHDCSIMTVLLEYFDLNARLRIEVKIPWPVTSQNIVIDFISNYTMAMNTELYLYYNKNTYRYTCLQ